MKTLTAALARLLLGMLLVSLAAACGGGNGGTPPPLTPTQVHAGTYFYQALSGNFGPPSGISWWGDYTSNGAGMVTGGTLSANTAGSVGSVPILPYAYTVDASYDMVWAAGLATEQTGGLSPDGRVGILNTTANASFPTLALALRKGGTFSTASLNGTYHVAGIFLSGIAHASFWGTVTFDGTGGTTWSLMRNSSGTVSAWPVPPDSYTVSGDGSVGMTLGTAVLQGGMLAGGELVAVCGTTLPAAPQLMMVCVPQSTTAGLATFSGNYHLCVFGFLLGGPPHFTTITGRMNADGTGGLNIPAGAIVNTDGGIGTTPIAIPGTYTVAADGTLTVSNTTGGVSPSGAFAFLSGRTTGGSTPELWLMLR